MPEHVRVAVVGSDWRGAPPSTGSCAPPSGTLVRGGGGAAASRNHLVDLRRSIAALTGAAPTTATPSATR